MNGIRSAAISGGTIAFSTAIASEASAAPPKLWIAIDGTSHAAISSDAAATSQERSRRPARKRGFAGLQAVSSPYATVDIDAHATAGSGEVIVPSGPSGRITWLGHSTTLIELDGAQLLTDPILRRRVAHLWRAGPRPEPGPVDAVLISHGHYDHLDLGSLSRLPRETPVVAPAGLGRAVRGFANVTEVAEGDEVEIGGVTVRATRADHPGRPAPRRSAAAVGYALLGSSPVYFAGDTDLFAEMDGLVDDLDLALIPVWGWGPTIGVGHLDPERAAETLPLLRPRIAVPIHWGTLRPLYKSSRGAFLREPPEKFAAAARRLAPDVDVRVLRPGESLNL
jgi:L-ascorbate metabolism protein UlaG (beta-lactamase superfamily)